MIKFQKSSTVLIIVICIFVFVANIPFIYKTVSINLASSPYRDSILNQRRHPRADLQTDNNHLSKNTSKALQLEQLDLKNTEYPKIQIDREYWIYINYLESGEKLAVIADDLDAESQTLSFWKYDGSSWLRLNECSNLILFVTKPSKEALQSYINYEDFNNDGLTDVSVFMNPGSSANMTYKIWVQESNCSSFIATSEFGQPQVKDGLLRSMYYYGAGTYFTIVYYDWNGLTFYPVKTVTITTNGKIVGKDDNHDLYDWEVVINKVVDYGSYPYGYVQNEPWVLEEISREVFTSKESRVNEY
ncbi:hypothetical protein JW887_01735 [Candidatus Dojkabacteria bacterium]|nr:hypothetical protein [Candidatus Dojkabacteria bacterium]